MNPKIPWTSLMLMLLLLSGLAVAGLPAETSGAPHEDTYAVQQVMKEADELGLETQARVARKLYTQMMLTANSTTNNN